MAAEAIELIKKHIGEYPNFPKPGVLFRDIFSVLKEPEAFAALRSVLLEHISTIQPPVECIVALDARGFLLGSFVALDLGIPFVPIRKKGKLPGKVVSCTYKLEYGEDTVEIQVGSIRKGSRVLIVDDLLATGGSLLAACQLINMVEGEVAQCLVVMELEALEGRRKLQVPVHSLLKY